MNKKPNPLNIAKILALDPDFKSFDEAAIVSERNGYPEIAKIFRKIKNIPFDLRESVLDSDNPIEEIEKLNNVGFFENKQ